MITLANIYIGDLKLFDLIFTILILGMIIFAAIYYKYSYKVIIGVGIFAALLLIAHIFSFPMLIHMAWLCGVIMICVILTSLNNKEKSKLLYHKKKTDEIDAILSVSETDNLFSQLEKTVTDLSANKIGAIITIEQKDNLTPFLSTSGVPIDAPVRAELLETIFVNKTPLHDGAVIIRGNYIVAASVFYQPTQKALNGKYGSRHRAAIGISEQCDAITIVVSEETGKVSFAINGDLIPAPVANFVVKLKEYYNQ